MATVDYTEPVLSLAECELLCADAMGYSVATATELTKIDQAITIAGQYACTFDGRKWPWLLKTARFQTNTKTVATAANSGATRSSNVSTITTTAVHGLELGWTVKIVDVSDSTFNGTFTLLDAPSTTTFTYAQVADDVAAATAGTGSVYAVGYQLRAMDLTGAYTATAAAQIMLDLYKIRRVYYDDNQTIQPQDFDVLRKKVVLLSTSGRPYLYSLSPGDTTATGVEPYLWLWPAPNDEYDITVDYIRRHSKITLAASTDSALIVPDEAKYGVYVEGATWLLKHDTLSPMSLRQCPGFMGAIDILTQSDHYDVNPNDMFPGTTGSLPHNLRVNIGDDTLDILGEVSV